MAHHVGAEHLGCRGLDQHGGEAVRVLHQRQPRIQQLLVGLHVQGVIRVQLQESDRQGNINVLESVLATWQLYVQ